MASWRIYLLRLWQRARERPALAFALVLGLLLLSLVGNALTFYWSDAIWEDGHDLTDAFWYSIVSVTTIGYGDFYPTSLIGRLGTFVFVVIIGLGTFSVALGLVFDRLSDWLEKGKRGMGKIVSDQHVLIVNLPDKTRVGELIAELRTDPNYAERDVVLVTDQVETNPFDLPRVYFVFGPPLQTETWQRAGVERAAFALVLGTGAPATSDSVVASIVSVIESLNHRVHTVAEVVNRSHKHLFRVARCDSVVCGNQVANNLLIQELQDHGTARVIEEVTTNASGSTLYSARVDHGDGQAYNDIAMRLLERDCNLLSVLRGAETRTTFRNLAVETGDTVVYVGHRRIEWAELVG